MAEIDIIMIIRRISTRTLLLLGTLLNLISWRWHKYMSSIRRVKAGAVGAKSRNSPDKHPKNNHKINKYDGNDDFIF